MQRLYRAFAERDIPAIIEMLGPEVEWGEPSDPFSGRLTLSKVATIPFRLPFYTV
jgi:hypothetical protein